MFSFLVRDWVSAKAKNYPIFDAIDTAIADNGWKIVLLIRLSPVIPFNVINYVLGITVRFAPTILAGRPYRFC